MWEQFCLLYLQNGASPLELDKKFDMVQACHSETSEDIITKYQRNQRLKSCKRPCFATWFMMLYENL